MAKFNYTYKDFWGGTHVKEGEQLTAPQVERVLTAHALGMLKRGGEHWNNPSFLRNSFCCINQAVANEPDKYTAFELNPGVALWFDDTYQPEWTVEEFLDAMRAAGVTKA